MIFVVVPAVSVPPVIYQRVFCIEKRDIFLLYSNIVVIFMALYLSGPQSILQRNLNLSIIKGKNTDF